MANFTTGIGKGLREPVGPFRQAYAFGAELNAVYADNWNAIPVIQDPTTSFDLSRISPGHEVVVALVGISGTSEGTYQATFEWRRNRDNALLYRYITSRASLFGGWQYAYSYIGYFVWEIIENGGYRVDITVTGPDLFSRTLNFNVSGILELVAPVPAPGNFKESIFAAVWNISAAVYSAYSEVKGWIWPFNMLQYPVYVLYQGFWSLLTPIVQFGDWVDSVSFKVSSILGQADIFGLLRTWLTYAQDAWSWVANAYLNVFNIVNIWWGATSQTVLVWVNEAKQYSDSLFSNLNATVANLQAVWDSFKGKVPSLDAVISWWRNWTGNVLSVVNTWWLSRLLDVQGLVDSAFTARQSLWSGWQDWRSSIAEFFTDPVEFIWQRFTDWFLGPEG